MIQRTSPITLDGHSEIVVKKSLRLTEVAGGGKEGGDWQKDLLAEVKLDDPPMQTALQWLAENTYPEGIEKRSKDLKEAFWLTIDSMR